MNNVGPYPSRMNVLKLTVFAVICLHMDCFSQSVQPAGKAVVVESLFKGGATEAWRGANDAGLNQLLARRRGELTQPRKIIPEKSKPAGGKNTEFASGGHIILSERDGDGKTLYFQAPNKFMGNHRIAFGGFISFGMRQMATDGIERDFPLIVLTSKTAILFYIPQRFPGPTWERIKVPLSADPCWFNMTSGFKRPASNEDIAAVLSGITEFWIRAEFHEGPDRAELAEVRFYDATAVN